MVDRVHIHPQGAVRPLNIRDDHWRFLELVRPVHQSVALVTLDFKIWSFFVKILNKKLSRVRNRHVVTSMMIIVLILLLLLLLPLADPRAVHNYQGASVGEAGLVGD